jgi:hypothetical protein
MMFLEKVRVLLGGNSHRTCDYVQNLAELRILSEQEIQQILAAHFV